MTTAKLKLTYDMVSTGLSSRLTEYDLMKSKRFPFNLRLPGGNNICLANSYKKRFINGARSSLLSTGKGSSLAFQLTSQKKHSSSAFGTRLIFNCGSNPSFVDESSTANEEQYLRNSSERAFDLDDKFSSQLQIPDAKREVIMLSWPAFAGQAIEPFAQLMETAYIGRIGSVELASAGISISIFNIISKLFNIPLLSIATSFVAEDISKNEIKHFNSENGLDEEGSNGKAFKDIIKKKHLSSVSTALVLAVAIGILEALALCIGSGLFLNLMGISKSSPMRFPAQKFLCLRALGAPAVVISLALQGIFRGFKDTRTPVLCLCIGNFSAIFLLPLLMYYLQLGVTGAAISTVISQYIVTLLMIWHLNKRVVLLPPKLRDLRFSGYLKSGGFLIGRTLAVLITMTLGTSMAVRQGPVSMAAHQICLQVWLAVSMLTDALAASAQALVASYLSKGDYKTSREVTNFVLKLGLLTGASLAVILGLSFSTLATLFTKDIEVLCAVKTVVLFVSASQPLNALAFIVDGLHFGVSDFKYAAYSMIVVGAISSAYLLCAPSVFGFRGVWSGLALFMGLRAVAGCIRYPVVAKIGSVFAGDSLLLVSISSTNMMQIIPTVS